MGKFLKFAALAVVILVIAAVVVLKSMNFNDYKGYVTDLVKKETGRDLIIEGDLGLSISLSPALTVEGVDFANASWGSEPRMARIKRVEAVVALLPLLTGNVQVQSLVLIEPNILLETNAEGQGNWDFKPAAAGAAPAPAANPPQLAIQEVTVENLRLSYRDGQKKETTTVALDLLSARAPSFSSPVELEVAGALNGTAFKVKGTTGPLGTLMDNGDWAVDLAADLPGIAATLKGTIAKPMDARKADLTVTVKAGDSDLSGAVKAALGGAKPVVSATLSSKLIRLADFTGPPAEAKANPGGKVFPSDPLPLGVLRAAEADAALKIARLDAGGIEVEDISATVGLHGGILSLKPLTSKLKGGTLGGSVVLTPRGNGAALSVDVTGKGIIAGDLVYALTGKDDLTGGPTDLTVNVQGVGSSVAGIMAGLHGKALAKVGKGRIDQAYVDLLGGGLVSFTKDAVIGSNKFTDMSCAVVNFSFTNGMGLAKQGLAMETTRMLLLGNSQLNLKTEMMTAGVKPTMREALDISAGGLIKPFTVTFPLGNPADYKIGVDAAGAVTAGAKVLGAVATGGLSLLGESVMDSSVPDAPPCQVALGVAPKAAPAEQQPAQQQQPSGGLGGKIGKGLKGLFGQ